MVLNRIGHCLAFLGLTLGSLAALAQEPVRHSILMPPDYNDDRYRTSDAAYMERLWALPDCQLQTAAESGQLFWACVISNPHPSPHDGWMWIGEISPSGQLLHSGYLSGGDEDYQSLGKGKILALSHNILILGQGTKLLAYQLSNDTKTQPLKPMWVVDVGFEIAEANIGANQQVLIWGYEKQEGQIQKVLIKIFDAKGKLINEKIEMALPNDSNTGRQFFLTDDGKIQVIGQQNNYRQSGKVPRFPGSQLLKCEDSDEECLGVNIQHDSDLINSLRIEEYRENFFSCISPYGKKEVEFEKYSQLPNQAVQAGFQYKNFAYAFFIINTENVKNRLQIYRFPRCEEFSNKLAATTFIMSLPADLIDAQIKQVKILPDETVLIAYTSVVGDSSQMQLLLSRVDLQQQKILWSKVVMPATPTNDQYLRLHEDKGKVQIEIGYDEKARQIGVAVFNNSINPNNWDDFPRPLDDHDFFPRIYTLTVGHWR